MGEKSEQIKTFLKKLDEYMNSDDFKDAKKSEEDDAIKRGDFLSRFGQSSIRNLTLEQYCFKKDSPGSFCYDLEIELKGYGNYNGRQDASKLYEIYADAQTPNLWYYKKGRTKKATSDRNKVEAKLEKIKDEISWIIENKTRLEKGDKKSINYFDNNIKINELVRNKIEYIYSDLNSSIPIYSGEHLGIILNELGLPYAENSSTLERRIILFNFYKKEVAPKYQNMSTYLLANFIYNGKYGYRYQLGLKVDSIEPATDDAIEREYRNNEIDPARAKAIGNKGEEIVEKRLEKYLKEGKIRGYTKYCGKQDDIGYDFDYTTTRSEIRHVEVKSTTTEYNKDKISFLISNNEVETYKKNEDSYLIFYVTGVFSNGKSKIHKLSKSEIEKGIFNPTKYRFNNK